MDYISELNETLKQLKDVQESIDDFNKNYDNDILRKIYMPSQEYLVSKLKQRIGFLLTEYIGGTDPDPDLWIRLQGPNFKEGRAPLSIVSSFIKKLILANQHAVTLLEEVKYDGKRINKKIKHLAELDLVATAPGSLKLGIKRPSIKYFVEVENPAQERIEAGAEIDKKLQDAEQDSERSIEGLKLLARAVMAAEYPEELNKLSAEIKDKKNVLKLLYYAREITPAQSSEIESVSFSGNFIKEYHTQEIVATKATRISLREISNKIIEHEKYVDGYGTIREIDLDKMSFRVGNLRFEDGEYDNIDCSLDREEFKEQDLVQLADKEIRLTGILIFSDTGDIKEFEVDKIYQKNYIDEE